MKRIILSFIVLFLFFIFYIVLNTPSYKTLDITSALVDVENALKKNQKIITFDSKNPFNFYDLIHNKDKIPDQKVYGILTKPNNKDVFPVIIGVAGSAGWGEHHYGYLDRYLKAGFAVFSLHSFKSRNVESTVGEQLTVTIPMMIYDSFKALEKLSKDPNIDAARAGLTGWSLGGGVTLFSAWSPIQEVISPNFKFAAHLPFYPPCMIIPEELRFTGAPIHILAGELDDWVPAAACEEFVEIASASSYDIGLTIYPGASHSFDRHMDVVLDNNAYSFTDCRMKLSKDGVVSLLNGFPLSTPFLQKIGLAFCAEKGAHWGGDKFAREQSSKFALKFMEKHLLAKN